MAGSSKLKSCAAFSRISQADWVPKHYCLAAVSARNTGCSQERRRMGRQRQVQRLDTVDLARSDRWLRVGLQATMGELHGQQVAKGSLVMQAG